MARTVVIGAGFAGHTAALYLGDEIGKSREITVINEYDYFAYRFVQFVALNLRILKTVDRSKRS